MWDDDICQLCMNSVFFIYSWQSHAITIYDQGDLAQAVCVDSSCKTIRLVMAPAMKAKKAAMKAMKGQKAMTKGALLGELATATEMKKSDITKILNTLTEIGTEEVKKSGKFVLPGLCMIKTRQKAGFRIF